ncbi:MAG: hypothetical protein ACE5G1_13085, partial [bacterium]
MSKVFDKISALFCRFRDWLLLLLEHRVLRYSPQVLMGIVIVATTLFMFPSSQSVQFANLKEDAVYPGEEIIAPFTFLINKTEEEIARDRQAAIEKVPPVFIRSDSIEVNQLQAFDEFYREVNAIRTSPEPDSLKVSALRNLLENFGIIIDQENLVLFLDIPRKSKNDQQSKSVKEKKTFETIRRDLRQILLDTYTVGILNQELQKLPPYVKKISVISTDRETVEDISKFFDPISYANAVLDNLKRTFPEQISTTVKIG